MAKKFKDPPKKKKRVPTGRFVQCPGSWIAHELVAVEVFQGGSGCYFALCGECMARIFLNSWDEGWGWTLAQVEAGPPQWGGMPARVVGLPPARRIQLMQGTTRS